MASSQLERTLRIDAEYFRHDFRAAELRVAAVGSEPITALAKVSDGNHFTISDAYSEEGIPYFRGQDISGTFFASSETAQPITREAYDRPYMRRSHLLRGDVLLSIVGTIGSTALFDSNDPATCSCKLAILRPKSISPAYLATYLASAYGQRRIEQLTRGALQRGLILEDADQILVPRLGGVEEAIDGLVARARIALDHSRSAITQAEATLLDALGLRDWSPPEPLTYTRSAVAVSGAKRFDANFFAPKYDSVLDRIRATGAAVALGDGLATLISRGKQPSYCPEGMPVVNSKHVRANRVILDADNRKAEPEKLRIRFGDVLINGTGVGTIGRAAPYLNDEEALPDNHVTVVRPSGIDPLYLSVFLNSKLGQMQIERMISGSSGQIEIYPDDTRRILVWTAPSETQTKIANGIRRAFELEQQSESLLAAAKRAVEIAIENGEAAALAFIAEQVA